MPDHDAMLKSIDDDTFADVKEGGLKLTRKYDRVCLVLDTILASTECKTGTEKNSSLVNEGGQLKCETKIEHVEPRIRKSITGTGHLHEQDLGVIKQDIGDASTNLHSLYKTNNENNSYGSEIGFTIRPSEETSAFISGYEDNEPELSIEVTLKEEQFNELFEKVNNNPQSGLAVWMLISSFCFDIDRKMGTRPFDKFEMYIEYGGRECLIESVSHTNIKNPFLQSESFERSQSDFSYESILKKIFFVLVGILIVLLFKAGT